MSNLQQSKRFDLIDKFNDTSRYLDDIFTIDNLEFAEHIPDILSTAKVFCEWSRNRGGVAQKFILNRLCLLLIQVVLI